MLLSTDQPLAPQLAKWRTEAAAPDADLRGDIARIADAAKQGEPEAAYIMAILVASGVGFPQDLKASLVHLQQAAENGHRAAQAELAALVGNWRLVTDINAGRDARTSWAQLRAAVNVDTWMRIPDGHIFSQEPRIATVKGYVSRPVCDWLISLGGLGSSDISYHECAKYAGTPPSYHECRQARAPDWAIDAAWDGELDGLDLN